MFLHCYIYLTFERLNDDCSLLLQGIFCLLSVLSDFSIIRSRLPYISSDDRGSTVVKKDFTTAATVVSEIENVF